MRKTILVTLIAALMLVTGGASAQAAMLVTGGASAQAATAICDLEPCANTVTEQYAVLTTDITTNVPVRYQSTFLGLANTALPFQPGDPVTPANIRRFIPSAAVVRVLWEVNRAPAGRAGYTCASAAIIRTDIADLRPYYTTGTTSLLNFTRFQPGEPTSPACAIG